MGPGRTDPLRRPAARRDQPVTLSGSALDQLANTCALQWFLGREVKADAPATAAQGFGNVVHVLADEVASSRTPADLDVLMERLDSVWNGLAFDAPGSPSRRRTRPAPPWNASSSGTSWTAAAAPHRERARLRRDPGGRRVRRPHPGLHGPGRTGRRRKGVRRRLQDRQERAHQGRGGHPPQLAVYQLAVREGAVDEVFDGLRPEPGGAELVQLRQPAPKKEGGDAFPKVQAQEPLAGEWVSDLLATAAGKVLDERFTPTTGTHCTHCTFRASCSAQPEGRQVVE